MTEEFKNLTPSQKRTRRKSAQKKLPKILENQNGNCYYCHRALVIHRLLRKEQIINGDPFKSAEITFMNDSGVIERKLVATIDHYQPLSQGGTNKISNLVASCRTCNYKKDNTPRTNFLCKRCTKLIIGKARGICRKCRYLGAKNWVEHHTSEHEKYKSIKNYVDKNRKRYETT